MVSRMERAKNQQLTTIYTAASLAGSYGKPELSAALEEFGKEVEAGTLTWHVEASIEVHDHQ